MTKYLSRGFESTTQSRKPYVLLSKKLNKANFEKIQKAELLNASDWIIVTG